MSIKVVLVWSLKCLNRDINVSPPPGTNSTRFTVAEGRGWQWRLLRSLTGGVGESAVSPPPPPPPPQTGRDPGVRWWPGSVELWPPGSLLSDQQEFYQKIFENISNQFLSGSKKWLISDCGLTAAGRDRTQCWVAAWQKQQTQNNREHSRIVSRFSFLIWKIYY